MSTRRFALVGGIIMIAMAFLSFIPALSQDPVPLLKVNTSYGVFLGFFPMNIFNKMALIIFGVAGIIASGAPRFSTAVNYSRTVFIALGALAILGLFPATNTLFGYWPLFGGEIVGHGVFALLGGYFGYVVPARVSAPQAHA